MVTCVFLGFTSGMPRKNFFAADARANALLSAFAQAINARPSAFTYLLRAAQVRTRGASGALQYAAHGGVKISARANSDALVVELKVQPGWHINAHQPLSENLIPTALEMEAGTSAWSLVEVSYPRPIRKTLGFQSEVLALYEGTVRLSTQLQPGENTSATSLLRINRRLKACDDEICLPPENVVLQAPVR